MRALAAAAFDASEVCRSDIFCIIGAQLSRCNTRNDRCQQLLLLIFGGAAVAVAVAVAVAAAVCNAGAAGMFLDCRW